MATITRTYTENDSSSYKATWTLTIIGADATASGANVTISAPTVQAKYVQSSKNKGQVRFEDLNLYTPSGTWLSSSDYKWITGNYEYISWTSGATKTIPRYAGSATATISTSSLFTSSNKSTRSVPIYIRGTNSGNTADVILASMYGDYEKINSYYGTPAFNDTVLNITLNVPPTFSQSFSYTNDFSGVPYANKTTANVTLSSLAAYYGGDFTGVGKATFTIGSQAVTKANPANNDVLSINLQNVGTFTPTVSVTDSRGQTTTHTLNAITVQGYNAPSVSFNTERTTSTGTPDDEGAYAVIDTTFTFTDAIATLSAPTVAVTDDGGLSQTVSTTWYSSRAADGTLSGSVNWANLSSGDTVYGLVSITGNFNTQKSYQIAVTPTDSEGTGTTITQTLGGAYYTVDFYAGGHGIAFGQPATTTGFECNMSALFKDDVLIDLPEYTTTGTTDKAIYDAIVALGWDSEVLV